MGQVGGAGEVIRLGEEREHSGTLHWWKHTQEKLTIPAGLNGHCGNTWCLKCGFFGGSSEYKSVIGVVCAENNTILKE